jgi:hypothetical protein
MNTGHDGSMGTLHANSPREALSRMESMITMGGFSLPSRTIRDMITSSVDIIVQASRLRDGSRRITHITEVLGMEGEIITTQDLFVYEILGEDANGRIIGRHKSTGVGRPISGIVRAITTKKTASPPRLMPRLSMMSDCPHDDGCARCLIRKQSRWPSAFWRRFRSAGWPMPCCRR